VSSKYATQQRSCGEGVNVVESPGTRFTHRHLQRRNPRAWGQISKSARLGAGCTHGAHLVRPFALSRQFRRDGARASPLLAVLELHSRKGLGKHVVTERLRNDYSSNTPWQHWRDPVASDNSLLQPFNSFPVSEHPAIWLLNFLGAVDLAAVPSARRRHDVIHGGSRARLEGCAGANLGVRPLQARGGLFEDEPLRMAWRSARWRAGLPSKRRPNTQPANSTLLASAADAGGARACPTDSATAAPAANSTVRRGATSGRSMSSTDIATDSARARARAGVVARPSGSVGRHTRPSAGRAARRSRRRRDIVHAFDI